MKPLFKNVLLRIEKEKKEELDALFNKRSRPEAILIEHAQDCDDMIHTLRGKKVLWSERNAITVEDNEDHIIVITPEESVILML